MASILGLSGGQPRNLAYATTGVRSDYRLMEVDEKLLPEIMGGGAVIKGGPDDEAVLCTATKTFALKLVDTSNLQLLVPPAQPRAPLSQVPAPYAPVLGEGLQTQLQQLRAADTQPTICIAATNASHIELVEVAPRLEPLHQVLQRCRYGQEQHDERQQQQQQAMEADGGSGGSSGSGSSTMPAFEELLASVQASASELRQALAEAGAVELRPGRWCLVDPDYIGGLLELLILTAQQEGLPLGALPREALSAALGADGYEPCIVAYCLGRFGRPVQQQEQPAAAAAALAVGEADSPIWALDERKVCVHFAHKVLGQRAWPLPDFMRAWAGQVPHGMQPSLDMLRGEALVEGDGGPDARVVSYPVCALPRDPSKRFAALFARQARWVWADLEPYLQDLAVPGMSVEALLLKYARGSQPTPDAPLTYSAR